MSLLTFALNVTYTPHSFCAVKGEAGEYSPHVFIYRVRLSGSLIPPTGVRPRKIVENGRIQLIPTGH